MSIKRSFKMDESGEYTESSSAGGKKTKTDASAGSGDSKEPVQEVRVLIENHQVGGIIGKAGANVRKVREDSKAFVSILKAEFRNVQERIMVLKGTVPQIAKSCGLIALLMLDGAKGREKKGGGTGGGSGSGGSGSGSGDGTGDSQVPFRFLVHKSAVGAIIGKAGATIKETQIETQTRIQVSNEPLPQSTEKTVTITGTVANIEAAALRILNQLKDNPLRSGTKSYPYVPGQPVYPPYGLPAGGGYGSPPPLYGAVASSPPPVYGYGSQSSPTSTQKIAIPTVCAGCVIGKGGSVIRDLRGQSGTSISIADPDQSSPDERVVTLTGTPQGVQTAVYLIRQLVEQYQPPPSY